MKSGWMKGTMILTITAFFVKLLSLLYKVPYQNISGDEGLYVFQQVYPLIGAKLISQDVAGKNPKELEIFKFNRY